MSCIPCLFLVLVAQPASAAFLVKKAQSCVQADLQHRTSLQNKLAGVCVDMCKEVGAFPKCTCPDFVPPDSTPNVMTWPELLEHMDNLSEWGHGELKAWTKQASSALQKSQQAGAASEEACLLADVQVRREVQNKLAGVCVDMCKEVGAYPKCTCPDFTPPDSTPGVMTWPELLEHMDNLSEWGHGELKAWTQQASLIQTGKKDVDDVAVDLEDVDEDDAKIVTGESVSADEDDQSEIDAGVEGEEQEETTDDAEDEDAVESDSSPESEDEDAFLQTRSDGDSIVDMENLDEDDARVVNGEAEGSDGADESEIDADAEADEASHDESTEEAEEQDADESEDDDE